MGSLFGQLVTISKMSCNAEKRGAQTTLVAPGWSAAATADAGLGPGVATTLGLLLARLDALEHQQKSVHTRLAALETQQAKAAAAAHSVHTAPTCPCKPLVVQSRRWGAQRRR